MIIYKLKQNIKSKEEKNFEGGIQMIKKSLKALRHYIYSYNLFKMEFCIPNYNYLHKLGGNCLRDELDF